MVRSKVYNSNTRRFEALLSKHFDEANVLTVCNATVGIMGTFYALGLSNSEIITTPLTWPGAFSGLKMLQCEVKFAEIEEPSLTIKPESILPLITPKTKAIFSADFLGYPCRLDEIKDICIENNLMLIHDASSSIGSTYKGSYSGKCADISIYSFGRNKPFTTNEGGCIVTHSDDLFDKIHFHLAHPERQAICSKEINPFFLNTSLNVFSVKVGVEEFENQLNKIYRHKTLVREVLTEYCSNETYFEKADPNFYKPFFKNIVRMGYSPTTNLPFFPLIANCGVTNQKLMKYNIIKDLCLPLENTYLQNTQQF